MTRKKTFLQFCAFHWTFPRFILYFLFTLLLTIMSDQAPNFPLLWATYLAVNDIYIKCRNHFGILKKKLFAFLNVCTCGIVHTWSEPSVQCTYLNNEHPGLLTRIYSVQYNIFRDVYNECVQYIPDISRHVYSVHAWYIPACMYSQTSRQVYVQVGTYLIYPGLHVECSVHTWYIPADVQWIVYYTW